VCLLCSGGCRPPLFVVALFWLSVAYVAAQVLVIVALLFAAVCSIQLLPFSL